MIKLNIQQNSMIVPVCRILATVEDEMETRKFCVYNQTSECFLSLGVMAAETLLAQCKQLVGKPVLRCDEGVWGEPQSGFHAFNLGMAVPLDLVYLDKGYKVVHVVESCPKFRFARLRTDAASVLALPNHTIYSSQTQPGNQLVICQPEEMEFRIGGTPGSEQPAKMAGFEPRMNQVNRLASWLSRVTSRDRRTALRQQWPRLVAHDSDGATLAVYGIRDASATGLYLLTEKRWPLGALVAMTLQRTENLNETSESSITVQLKVTRWGLNGVGLAFVLPDDLESAQWPEEEPIGDDLQAVAMQDRAKWATH